MPYLKRLDKLRLEKNKIPKRAGDINYLINIMLYSKFQYWYKQDVIDIGSAACLNFPSKDIAAIMKAYINNANISYQRINDCIGACVCAIYEFIRRNPCQMPIIVLQKWDTVVIDFTASWYERNAADYEDEKIQLNGDIFLIREVFK